ncbi:MAG: GHKL domain-containing protein [Eubacteriales bacterium]|nr:GHKL domain-containing protein [Eubacteriales bacterium]
MPAYFLRFTFGFFQQIFPCMVLLSLPYDREDFPYGRKRSFAAVSALCLVLSLLFGVIVTALFFRPGPRPVFFGELREGAIGNAYMIVVVILLILFYWNTVRSDFNKKMIVLILALDYAILEYMLVNSMIYLLDSYFHIENADIYTGEVLVLFLVFKAFALPSACLFMARTVKRFLSGRNGRMVKRSLFMVFLLTVLYILFLAECTAAYESVFDFQTTLLRLHFIAVFLFGLVSLAVIYWYIFREADLDMKESEFRHQLEIQQLQYNAIRSDIDKAARMRHDIRHHLRVMGRFLEEGKQKEAMDYLQDVTNSFYRQETEQFCKDPVLNALLQYYFGEAKKKQIRLEFHIDVRDCRVDPADMTVVVGNLLENAIHACEQVKEDRFIRFYMGVVNNVLAMILENSAPELEASEDQPKICGKFMSGEKVCLQPWAGIGLKSVISTVRKYRGSSEFRYVDGVFCSRLNMEWETKDRGL